MGLCSCSGTVRSRFRDSVFLLTDIVTTALRSLHGLSSEGSLLDVGAVYLALNNETILLCQFCIKHANRLVGMSFRCSKLLCDFCHAHESRFHCCLLLLIGKPHVFGCHGFGQICSHLREVVICAPENLSGVCAMRRVSVHEEDRSSSCEKAEEA